MIYFILALLVVWCAVSWWMFKETFAKALIPDFNWIGKILIFPAILYITIVSYLKGEY